MKFRVTAITIVGVQIEKEKLFEKYLKNCNCMHEFENINYCKTCKDKKIGFDIPFTFPNDQEAITQKCYFDIYQNNNEYLFICLSKETENGPENIKCLYSLEKLIQRRDFLSKILIQEKLLSEEEFKDSFGIYTLIENCL